MDFINISKAKKIRLLTSLFNRLLLIYTYFFYHSTYKDIKRFTSMLEGWNSVVSSNHVFGGTQFDYMGKEICHIHGNGIVDILWKNREERDYLIANDFCDLHYIESDSRWTTIYLDGKNLGKAVYAADLHYKTIIRNESFLTNESVFKPSFK